MHVAYVIDNLGSGGAQRQAVEVAVRLHREGGVRVSFAVYRRVDFFKPRLVEAGVEVDELPKRGPVDPVFPFRLRAWLLRRRPDVLHAFLPAPTVWTALARWRLPGRAPVWIGGERSSPHDSVGRSWARLLRRAYATCDAVTANSHPAVSSLSERFGVGPARVHYLPNGIDLEDWDRRAARPPPEALEPGRFHMAMVGRLAEEKRHRLLLDALSRLVPGRRARLRVWFVGARDAPARVLAELRDEVARLGLADVVRMLPPTPELPAFMARLDALVLASRYEGFPNVVLEAMASRLPVVATAVGDVPWMIEDGETGYVVPPGDAGALAAALSRLLEATPEARATMGAAARAAVESRYRMESVARSHLELYRQLLRSAGTPRAAAAS